MRQPEEPLQGSLEQVGWALLQPCLQQHRPQIMFVEADQAVVIGPAKRSGQVAHYRRRIVETWSGTVAGQCKQLCSIVGGACPIVSGLAPTHVHVGKACEAA